MYGSRGEPWSSISRRKSVRRIRKENSAGADGLRLKMKSGKWVQISNYMMHANTFGKDMNIPLPSPQLWDK